MSSRRRKRSRPSPRTRRGSASASSNTSNSKTISSNNNNNNDDNDSDSSTNPTSESTRVATPNPLAAPPQSGVAAAAAAAVAAVTVTNRSVRQQDQDDDDDGKLPRLVPNGRPVKKVRRHLSEQRKSQRRRYRKELQGYFETLAELCGLDQRHHNPTRRPPAQSDVLKSAVDELQHLRAELARLEAYAEQMEESPLGQSSASSASLSNVGLLQQAALLEQGFSAWLSMPHHSPGVYAVPHTPAHGSYVPLMGVTAVEVQEQLQFLRRQQLLQQQQQQQQLRHRLQLQQLYAQQMSGVLPVLPQPGYPPPPYEPVRPSARPRTPRKRTPHHNSQPESDTD